jgi:hypothetical protein
MTFSQAIKPNCTIGNINQSTRPQLQYLCLWCHFFLAHLRDELVSADA